MDLNALRQFLTVARTEHLSRAAAELRIAQPALSRTIARLESDLGAPLFDRVGRLRLNDAGKVFRNHAERALGELDAGRRAVSEAAGGTGSVRLASETFLPLTGPLAAFKIAHPQVEVLLRQMAPDEMRRALDIQDVDLCLASQPVGTGSTSSTVVHTEPVWLATPPGHRLAGAERVPVEDLADEPFVITRRGQWQRSLLVRLFADRDLEPRVICETDEPAATFALVSAGLGLSLFPAIARETFPEQGVAWAGVDHPHCDRTLSLHWVSDDRLPAAARLMRSQILDWSWSSASPSASREPVPGPGLTTRPHDNSEDAGRRNSSR
jgi:DNA-binding transcriptional LysR family regulator